MLAPKTDIVNPPYCDIICTTTIIVFTFTIGPSRQHRFIFPWLLVAAAILYVQNRYRILRWELRSFYGSRSLHDVEAVYWALPLGLLAAAWERNMAPNSTELLQGKRFFFTHLFMHLLFLRYVVPQQQPQMPASRIEYKKTFERLGGKACLADYLNTNPIEVLKSHFQHETSTIRRLIYYRLDKEYLQERAFSMFKGEEDHCNQLSHTVFHKFPQTPEATTKEAKEAGEALLSRLSTQPVSMRSLFADSSDDDSSVAASEKSSNASVC